MASRAKIGKQAAEEKTFIKGLSFIGAQAMDGNPINVDVKNGKIVRLRPLHYDWKYNPEEFNPWKIEARGSSFEPKMKSNIDGDAYFIYPRLLAQGVCPQLKAFCFLISMV